MSDVLIIGGGIGGLTLALALHAKGIGCRVLEAANEYQLIGAGVNLLPHAVAIFAQLGLEAELAHVANKTTELKFYNQHGQEIHAEPRGLAAGHSWPQYSIHRGHLHSILLNAFRNRIGAQALIMGHRCKQIDQTPRRVVVTATHQGTERNFIADAVVGCDGIHSRVRSQLCPENNTPIFSGVTMWRGVSEIAGFLTGGTMILAGSLRTGKIVAYPIQTADAKTGLQLVNWVAELRTGHLHDVRWDDESDQHELSWANRDWNLPGLDVPTMLRAAPTVLRYPMVDKDPLRRWTFGRATLLGDAAHPMYPFGSNGACQAIVDAQTLADCISNFTSTEVALQRYEALRLPLTREVTLLNRVSPPDVILDEIDRLTDGHPVPDIRSVMSAENMTAILTRYQFTTAKPTTAPEFRRAAVSEMNIAERAMT